MATKQSDPIETSESIMRKSAHWWMPTNENPIFMARGWMGAARGGIDAARSLYLLAMPWKIEYCSPSEWPSPCGKKARVTPLAASRTESSIAWSDLKPLAEMGPGDKGRLTRLLEDVELDHDVLKYLEDHRLMPGVDLELARRVPDARGDGNAAQVVHGLLGEEPGAGVRAPVGQRAVQPREGVGAQRAVVGHHLRSRTRQRQPAGSGAQVDLARLQPQRAYRHVEVPPAGIAPATAPRTPVP